METFALILLLLAIILVSTVFSQFLSRVSLPLIQIALGIILALFALNPIEFHVDPELFLILFIAPLLFDESRHVNKRDLWKNRGSILSLAIGLVLLTVLVVGFVLNWLIPSLPLAAAFALGAALGPTDAVAVSALSKDASISKRQKSLLSGESLINDASGVVSFQFAIAAAVTGSFSLIDAGETFLITFVGGVLIGLVLGAISLYALRKIREHGYESTTVHVVFELFIPFIIFFIAEHLQVSGILAVVAAGLLITLFPQKLTPMVSRLNIVSRSVWDVVVFVINGVIFVMLGIEIPQAFMAEWDVDHITTNIQLVLYVLLTTFLVISTRFLWIVGMETFTKDPKTKKRSLKPTGKRLLDSLVTTLAGPKGAISLSIAFTIPYTIASGADFPHRSFLIFVASGTILCTLLLANFIVPLLAPKTNEDDEERRRVIAVDIEILQNVILELKANQTSETAAATGITVRSYKDRIAQLRQQETDSKLLQKIRIELLQFQEEYIKHRIDQKSVDQEIGEVCLKRVTRIREALQRSKRAKRLFETISNWRKSSEHFENEPDELAYEKELRLFRIEIEEQTVTYLEKRIEKSDHNHENNEKCLATLLSEVKSNTVELHAETDLLDHVNPREALEHIQDIESEGLRLELEQIQLMFEDDRLSRADARELREEVYLMQTNLATYH